MTLNRKLNTKFTKQLHQSILSVLIKLFLSLPLIIFTNLSYADNSFYASMEPIPQDLQQKMIGNSWHEGCPINLNDLSYLRMSYWGFDNKSHLGDMIINQQLAPEVIAIFKKLYDAHYPIEKMMIPEELIGGIKFSNTLDFAAFVANSDDTYGFFCRIDAQNPKNISPHSYGTCIDLNPYYNPGVISPDLQHYVKGIKYLDRNLQHIGMIRDNDAAIKAFMNSGWLWHGYATQTDYMHFSKLITNHYQINHIDSVLPGEGINTTNN